MNRRQALLTGLSAAIAAQSRLFAQASPAGAKLRHSVCRATFAKVPLDEFCEACKGLGIESIELLEPADYATVLKHGLECAVGRFTTKRLPDTHINCGWNNPEYHPVLIEGYTELIQKTADAGFKKVICFSGLRKGLSDAAGIENCAAGLSKLMPLCDKLGVTMVMELLNSKVNHPDYQCDRTAWGVELCKRVGSPRMKLLYDIYHMQIMEGDVIRTIRDNYAYLAHFHTAGNPGRHEMDDTQEMNYKGIAKAIADLGFQGFVAHEYTPLGDAMSALETTLAMFEV